MKVIAVTTTFFPDEGLIYQNFENIRDDIEMYIVVDNSEGYTFQSLSLNANFEIVKNTNVGVSGGLNVGILRAIELGADCIILFDQDSLSEKGLVNKLLDAPGVRDGNVIAAPNILDRVTGDEIHDRFFSRGKAIDDQFIEINRTQMSGLLIPVPVFLRVGVLNENYFLNYVDTEWCLRATARGCKILIRRDAVMYHDFGEGKKRIFSYCFWYGKPFRGYYSSRDALFLLRESSGPLVFKGKLFLSLIWSFLQVLFLDEKRLRIKYLFRGVLDYFKGIRKKGTAF